MKILFINPFGIGDVLFTSALIKPLKEKGNLIYYWCNERVSDILRYNEKIEGIFPLSRGDLKRIFKKSITRGVRETRDLVKKLKVEKFDIAIDFSLDYRYSFLLRLLGVKKIVGFDYKRRGRFLTDRITISGFNDRHMVDYYAILLNFIDKEAKGDLKMELAIGNEEKRWCDEFLGKEKIDSTDILLGIAPGGGMSWGSNAFIKHWPRDRFAHVCNALATVDKYKVVLFGSEEEKEICNFISKKTKDNVINLCGKITLGQFAALLRRCRVLLANDGGPLHMASSLGVKTVSIFGPVDEKVYGPYPPSRNHTILTDDIGCRPCYKNFSYPLCRDRICLNSIEPSEVLEAVRASIKEKVL